MFGDALGSSCIFSKYELQDSSLQIPVGNRLSLNVGSVAAIEIMGTPSLECHSQALLLLSDTINHGPFLVHEVRTTQ